jgi:hypothetical protein
MAGTRVLALQREDSPEGEVGQLPSSCWIITDRKDRPVGTSDALGREEGGLLAVYTSAGLANTISIALAESFSGVNEFPPKPCDMGFRVQFYTKADLLKKFPQFKRAVLDWQLGEGNFLEKNEKSVPME